MTDLNDINRNVALGNLVGLAQHREAMARQEEVAALLRKQEQEQSRLKELPKCPKCKLSVEIGAELCPNCRTDIACTPRLISQWCRNHLGHVCGVFVRTDAPGRIDTMLTGLSASLAKINNEAKKLVADLGKTAAPLKMLATVTDKVVEYSQCCASIEAVEETKKKEKEGCLFMTGLLMVFFVTWGAILFFVMKAADSEITWYWNAVMFFVYGALAFVIAAMVMGALASLDGSASKVTNAGRRKSDIAKAINASLQQKSPRGKSELAFPEGMERAAGKCLELISKINSLRKTADSERADWNTLAVFGRSFGVSQHAPPSWLIPPLQQGPAKFSEADAGESLSRQLSSIRDAEKAVGILSNTDRQARTGSHTAIESSGDIWIRLPSGKRGGPYQPMQVRRNQSEGKYPVGTEWSQSADGPWEVLVASDAKPVSTEMLWIRTPQGKCHGPFSMTQVKKAIADGKIPAGCETAFSADGPWEAIHHLGPAPGADEATDKSKQMLKARGIGVKD